MVSFGVLPAEFLGGGSAEERALSFDPPPVGIEGKLVHAPIPAISRDAYIACTYIQDSTLYAMCGV